MRPKEGQTSLLSHKPTLMLLSSLDPRLSPRCLPGIEVVSCAEGCSVVNFELQGLLSVCYLSFFTGIVPSDNTKLKTNTRLID